MNRATATPSLSRVSASVTASFSRSSPRHIVLRSFHKSSTRIIPSQHHAQLRSASSSSIVKISVRASIRSPAAAAQFSTSAAAFQVKPQAQQDLDPYEQELFGLLTSEFNPEFLDVRDVSGGCGSMFYINIVSEKFNGLPLVKQHQAVNAVLKDEISKWHGLQLRTKALDKYKK